MVLTESRRFTWTKTLDCEMREERRGGREGGMRGEEGGREGGMRGEEEGMRGEEGGREGRQEGKWGRREEMGEWMEAWRRWEGRGWSNKAGPVGRMLLNTPLIKRHCRRSGLSLQRLPLKGTHQHRTGKGPAQIKVALEGSFSSNAKSRWDSGKSHSV